MINHMVLKSCDTRFLQLQFLGQSQHNTVQALGSQKSTPWIELQFCEKVFGACKYRSKGIDWACGRATEKGRCRELLQLPNLTAMDATALETKVKALHSSWENVDPTGFWRKHLKEQA